MKRELSRDTAGREGNTCNSEDQGEVGVVKAAKLVEHATATVSASTSASDSDNASLQSSTSHNHHSGTGSISSTGSDGVVTSGSGSGSKSTAATTPPKLLYFLIHKPREVLSDRIDSKTTLKVIDPKSAHFGERVTGIIPRTTVYEVAARAGFPSDLGLADRLDYMTSGI